MVKCCRIDLPKNLLLHFLTIPPSARLRDHGIGLRLNSNTLLRGRLSLDLARISNLPKRLFSAAIIDVFSFEFTIDFTIIFSNVFNFFCVIDEKNDVCIDWKCSFQNFFILMSPVVSALSKLRVTSLAASTHEQI